VLQIRDVYLFFHPESRVEKMPDRDPQQRIEEFLTKKPVSKLWDVHPGSRIRNRIFFPSRILDPEPVFSIRIPDLDLGSGSATLDGKIWMRIRTNNGF
jgi:hypothetical protein